MAEPISDEALAEMEAAAIKANGDGVRWSLAEPERERGHEVLIDYDHPEPADADGASLLHDQWLLQADAVHIAAADPATVLALLARLRAAEARAVPEGETVIDGKRWRLEGEWVDHGMSVEFLYRLVDP